jgi:hypothetical protein
VMVARLPCHQDLQAGSDVVRFDAAHATVHAVLAIAAQRPWCAVFDCALSFRSAHGGAPWRLFEGLLHAIGYSVDAVVVCPSQ